MSNVIIKAEGLHKSFASEGEQSHVLSDINIEIYEKDFTVIMGASGSGKSTLLYCLSGMDTATSGKITYMGKVISDYREKKLIKLRRRDFGFVFQKIHMVSNLTMLENIVVPAYLNKKFSAVETRKKAEEYIKMFGIDGVKNHLPKQTSGGEQQRAAIARALINEPRLLFADEPTGALNRKNGTEVLDLLNEINNKGQSVLMVTHDIKAAVRANRILYISDGKIIDEMSLAPYKEEETMARETQINSWLSSLCW